LLLRMHVDGLQQGNAFVNNALSGALSGMFASAMLQVCLHMHVHVHVHVHVNVHVHVRLLLSCALKPAHRSPSTCCVRACSRRAPCH
jgi:hypothetical protein